MAVNNGGGKFHSVLQVNREGEEKINKSLSFAFFFLLCIFSLENNLKHPGIVF